MYPFWGRHPFHGIRGRDLGSWWDYPEIPSRIFDQNFGSGMMNDTIREMNDLMTGRSLRRFPSLPAGPEVAVVNQPQVTSGVSEVKNDDNVFQVHLDVSQFAPEEVKVKTVENCVIVEGKHEERADEHGFIMRHFVRRYILPKGVNPETVTSKLAAGGVLTIEAPKAAIEGPPERIVPIKHESAN
jgi:crystallin alpha B